MLLLIMRIIDMVVINKHIIVDRVLVLEREVDNIISNISTFDLN
jgi:hypothetical protein